MPALGTQQLSSALTNEEVATVTGLTGANRVSFIARFTDGGSGSPYPTCKVYIQTSLNRGSNWYDIACFAFDTTSTVKGLSIDAGEALNSAVTMTTGSLSDDTTIDGVLGERIRMVVTTTETYAGGSSISVDYYAV